MIRLAALLTLLTAAAGCGGSKCGPSEGVVQFVIDGDTIQLENGARIRMLLVDTPETTGGKMDCYGQEAAAYTRAQLEGKAVQLTYDEAGCSDRYGRTLAYVKVGGVDHNAELMKQGLACSLFIAPAGTARKDEFDTLESEAKTNRAGMWGACTSIPCDK